MRREIVGATAVGAVGMAVGTVRENNSSDRPSEHACATRTSPTSSPKRPRSQQGGEPHKILCTGTDTSTQRVSLENVGLAEVFGSIRSRTAEDTFFSYRFEHRSAVTPSLAMHPGEERMLIFASNRPGVVAKIVFSSSDPAAVASAAASVGGSEEIEVEARIHVLEIKEGHRGHGLGELLFLEAMQALRRRYSGRTIRCQLDAEEDITRHNRLVNFYERLGCSVKPNAKVQYLNNMHIDGDTYRKVPMVIVLRPTTTSVPVSLSFNCSFLPINRLLCEDGFDIALSDRRNRKLQWILIVVDGIGSGHFQFRTTCGRHLCATSSGEVCVGEHGQDQIFFTFQKASGNSNNPDFRAVSDSEESDSDGEDCKRWSLNTLASSHEQLWTIQALGTRLFLTTDPCTKSLFLSSNPTAYWLASKKDWILTCLAKQSPRRIQRRNTWRYQTVANVNTWRHEFLNFELCGMSIQGALDLASSIPLYPVSGDNSSSKSISVRTFCYCMAEHFRRDGCPDWLMFVALVHELGRCVRLLEKRRMVDEIKNDEHDYDWTVACPSRIVGCSRPPQASPTHDEFRTLCPDEGDPLYTTELGIYEERCGLSTVLMQWSGPEYTYWMLRHNGTMLPELALQIIRYFPLSDWHRRGKYSALSNASDEMNRSIVSEFDDTRRIVRRKLQDASTGTPDLSDSECERLWQSFYCHTVAKYGCGGDLSW